MKTYHDVCKQIDQVTSHEHGAPGATAFQLRHFVLESQPTVFGQYRQACVELERRKVQYQQLELKLKLVDIDIAEITKSDDSPDRKEINLQIKNIERNDVAKSVAETLREIEILVELAQELLPSLPDVTWDEHQVEYWVKKLGREAWLSWNTTGVIPSDVLRAVMVLPRNERDVLLGQIKTMVGFKQELLNEATTDDETASSR